MTPHFPVVTSKELERALNKLGFEIDHIKGSHVVFRRAADNKRAVVPRHSGKALKRKVVDSVLKSIGITTEELKKIL